MKRIAVSRTARYIVFCLQFLFLLSGEPLTSAAQGMPSRTEMRAMGLADAVSWKMPAADCRSFAFCCLAPPVPARVFDTLERLDPECMSTECRFEVDSDTFYFCAADDIIVNSGVARAVLLLAKLDRDRTFPIRFDCMRCHHEHSKTSFIDARRRFCAFCTRHRCFVVE
ncbi:hypothetical protein ACHMW6_25425 [Pseudoduganella sp. UC29_106]|uniref:hypothetical protein n=1 Tax=Pseudoduganella sp. UC29_106 TaxID=3374553 RepID=UPI003757E400